jgi:UDP-glucose 4-epimerase
MSRRNVEREIVIRSWELGLVLFEPLSMDALHLLEEYHETHPSGSGQLLDEGFVVDLQDARLVVDVLEENHFEYAIHAADQDDLTESLNI